jgi:hypothetical protein
MKKSRDITSSDRRPSGVTAKYVSNKAGGRLNHKYSDNIRWIIPVHTSRGRPAVRGRKKANTPVISGIRKTISTMKHLFL